MVAPREPRFVVQDGAAVCQSVDEFVLLLVLASLLGPEHSTNLDPRFRSLAQYRAQCGVRVALDESQRVVDPPIEQVDIRVLAGNAFQPTVHRLKRVSPIDELRHVVFGTNRKQLSRPGFEAGTKPSFNFGLQELTIRRSRPLARCESGQECNSTENESPLSSGANPAASG